MWVLESGKMENGKWERDWNWNGKHQFNFKNSLYYYKIQNEFENRKLKNGKQMKILLINEKYFKVGVCERV